MLTKLEKRILKSASGRNDDPQFAWIKLEEIISDLPNTSYSAISCACCSLHNNGYLDECIRCLDGNIVLHLSQMGVDSHKVHRTGQHSKHSSIRLRH